MKAVLLAGGLGTRLRPLTHTRPKHLLPIGNKAHIEHVLDHLAGHDIRSVVLTTSHLASAFDAVADGARRRGMDVTVTHESEPLGTGGALKHARAAVGDETFLVFNADVLTTADLAGLVDYHRKRSAEATMLLTPVADPSRYGVVPTGDDGRVLSFIEKPPRDEAVTNEINAGVYVMEPAVLDRIPEGRAVSAELELFPPLVADGRLFAIATDAYWIDIGTPQSYLQANLDVIERAGGKSLVADGAAIDPSARVDRSCVGAGGVIEAGAQVERSVLLPRARIERDAVVRDSIVGEGSTVAVGFHAEGVTLQDETKAE
jgi:mannose-1-phosphate guanylyltransferase